MSQGDTIQVEDLPPTIAESRGENAVHIPLGITMAEAEKAIILENLAFLKEISLKLLIRLELTKNNSIVNSMTISLLMKEKAKNKSYLEEIFFMSY